MAKWRYQPVYADEPLGRVYSLCECHFDKDGLLEAWTEEPAMVPQGETIEELSGDLARMMVDTRRWEPVAFSDLKVGMKFKPVLVDVTALMEELDQIVDRRYDQQPVTE